MKRAVRVEFSRLFLVCGFKGQGSRVKGRCAAQIIKRREFLKWAKPTAFALFLWKRVPEGRVIAGTKSQKKAKPTYKTSFLWKEGDREAVEVGRVCF